MRQPLHVEIVQQGTEVVVGGRLDSLSCDELRTALQSAVAEGEGDLLLHAHGLEIWGSAALGVLVGASRAARRRDRRLVVSGLGAREIRLVKAGHLDRLLVLDPGEAGAEARSHDVQPA